MKSSHNNKHNEQPAPPPLPRLPHIEEGHPHVGPYWNGKRWQVAVLSQGLRIWTLESNGEKWHSPEVFGGENMQTLARHAAQLQRERDEAREKSEQAERSLRLERGAPAEGDLPEGWGVVDYYHPVEQPVLYTFERDDAHAVAEVCAEWRTPQGEWCWSVGFTYVDNLNTVYRATAAEAIDAADAALREQAAPRNDPPTDILDEPDVTGASKRARREMLRDELRGAADAKCPRCDGTGGVPALLQADCVPADPHRGYMAAGSTRCEACGGTGKAQDDAKGDDDA